MLVRLEIQNFALITNSVFEPKNGLTAITGETGAGKSLLIDALSIILGAKTSKSVIRSGADNATVEAVFDIADDSCEEMISLLDETGITHEDGLLIIERKVSIDGKSIARINGRSVILSTLRQICSFLVDIHGQHDTQKIFDERSHVDLLDSYGADDIIPALTEYRENLNDYKKIVLEIRNLSVAPDSIRKRKEYLEFAINEIEDAKFYSGEEEKLYSRQKQIKSGIKIAEILSNIDMLLTSDTGDSCSAVSRISQSLSSAESLSKIDDSYKELLDDVNELYNSVEIVSDKVNKLLDAFDFDQNELTNIENRIGLLLDLKSKYGPSIEAINNFCNEASNELKNIDNLSVRLVELKKERADIEKKLLVSADKLSEVRRRKAVMLSNEIIEVLKDLEIPSARFDVEFTKRSKDKYFNNYGYEDIRFIFSANPGEELKPLSSIASGGEASRIMLAIKTILSEADKIPTLIFDEIDTGVSGVSANQIAYKLRQISKKHQVLCVTHTAQLAASADNNYKIIKDINEDSTNSSIVCLENDAKVYEISRLLSGELSDESLELAKKLINSFS